MKRTIKEIEQDLGEDFEVTIEEYYESCIRNGYYDMAECASYFVSENSLAKSEYPRVYASLKALNKEA